MATQEDLPELCVLGRMVHAETSFAPMTYDIDHVKETLSGLIDKKQFVVVAEGKNGELIGGIAGYVVPSWFGPDLVANDLILAVHPDHRGGLLAAVLVRWFIRWAKLAGAKQIRPGVVSGCEVAEGLYSALGFRRCGSTFLMEGA